ncbi:AAA family ATPase [Tepidiforma bonchosmolovskayae]|jgi:adenylate kinase family enzyme|uniref:AAA family ATPase n=1 Tax=Tepidiforma bonchosmolovskayae TaxID=2601677 RepID=A0ABX6C0T2_9CHLR|nr:AAA family ATPase [Tepidiforma bonchosmolovskayae]QFG02693.1 AAA family ATPase [Tepidiforma bonchosmolovskayae]
MGAERPVPFGRRVAVYGPAGSGKSTLARALRERLGLPVVELDAVYHARPNWQDLSREEFRAAVTRILAEHPDGWVIEGNYAVVRDLVLPLAEAVVWLDLPFGVVYRRLAMRTIGRALAGAELWNGNRETPRQTFFSRNSMLLWGLTAFRRTGRGVEESLRTLRRPGVPVYRLRTPGQAAYLLRNARPAGGAHGPAPTG